MGDTDWEEVVKESEASNVRVSRANETWQVATSLPRQFAVPAHVTDDKLAGVAGLGLGTRPPVWVWGTKGGGNLFIQPQSNVLESDEVRQQYRDFYHRDQKGERNTINLDETFSHPLEEAFVGMLELHCLETEKEADEKDTKYLTSLEATGWMSAVGAALRIARDVAERVQQGKLVVLIEGEGRSSSPMVASLAMILLSEEFRTRRGWQRLVQANWLSLFATSHFSKSYIKAFFIEPDVPLVLRLCSPSSLPVPLHDGVPALLPDPCVGLRPHPCLPHFSLRL